MSKVCCLALLSAALGCSVADKDRCSEGRTWNPEYSACFDPAGGAASAGSSSIGGSQAEQVDAGDAGGAGSAGGASTTNNASNLGTACTKDADCAGGLAPSCLLNPQAPSDPGICTVLNCDAAACGALYDCCDCSASPILGSSWPESKCIPTSSVPTLTQLSCTCS